MEGQEKLVDSRYRLKDDCNHNMDQAEDKFADLYKKWNEDAPKKFVSVDKFKPIQWLVYTTIALVLSGFVGGILSLIWRKVP